MNGIRALEHETPERFPSAMWLEQKGQLPMRKQALSRYQICTLILAFPASRIERNEFLLIISHLIYGIFVVAIQMD